MHENLFLLGPCLSRKGRAKPRRENQLKGALHGEASVSMPAQEAGPIVISVHSRGIHGRQGEAAGAVPSRLAHIFHSKMLSFSLTGFVFLRQFFLIVVKYT